MQPHSAIYQKLSKELAGIEAQMKAFSDVVCAELKKPARDRDPGKIAEFEQMAKPLQRSVMIFGHTLNHEMSAALRAKAAGEDVPDAHVFMQNLQETQNRMQYWTSRFLQLPKALPAQFTSRRIPLYTPDLEPDNPDLVVVDTLARALVKLDFMVNTNAQDPMAAEHGCFSDIRLPAHRFVEHMHAAYRVALAQRLEKPVRFLDVGCGSGVKVMMANEFFTMADGLEFDPGYAEAARDLFEELDLDKCNVIEGDALVFEHYQRYDIVYFYQPMNDNEKLKELERVIVANVRPGTILVAPYAGFRVRCEDLGCGHLDGSVFLAGASEAEAAEVLVEAEQTGAAVLPNPKVIPWGEAWRPIQLACAANGHQF